MNIPYTLSDRTLTLYVEGESYTVPRDWHGFDHLKILLSQPEHDVQAITDHVGGYNPNFTSQAFVVEDGMTLSDIEVTRHAVFFKGQKVNSTLATRMIDVQSQGLPLDPWIKFMANVYDNPADYARSELYEWLERSTLPITDDGCFLAFKRVRDGGVRDQDDSVESQYTDLYTGTFDNSPGKVVSMPRKEVDSERDHHCSTGLHFCSASYLSWYGHSSNGNATLLVKINPADVVSIPNDHGFAKGRTWKYEVLQVIPDAVELIEWEDSVINTPDLGDDWVQWEELANVINARSTKRSVWQRAKDWWVGS